MMEPCSSAVLIILVALFLVVEITTGSRQFTFKEYGSSFTVSINNTEIIKHSPHRPFVYIGSGETTFSETYGNFDINDYTHQRIGLSNYKNVIYTKNGVNITMYFCTAQVSVHLGSEEGHPLTVDISDLGDQYDRLWVQIAAQPDDAIYGGGEQYSYLNLRGLQYPIWTREQGIGRNKSDIVTFVTDLRHSGGDYFTTYFPQPTFYSSQKYYFHHGGSNYAILDFGHRDFHEVFIQGKPGRLYFNTGNSFDELVTKLTRFLGRMPPLPDWVYDGAIIGVQGGTQKMLDYVSYSKNYNIPVTGVWIQDWAGYTENLLGKRLFWNWRWNETVYPGLDKAIVNLQTQNIRVLGYINPYLTIEGDLYKYADSMGYLVKNATNQTYILDFEGILGGSVDLTNPDAFNWYKNGVIKENMIKLGLGGWMADFSEYLPVDAVLYNNQPASMVHNQWPVLWARLNREAVEESEKLGDIIFFMRAGFSGTGNYTTLMWAGDQDVDFSYGDGLASTIPASLNMGLSGVGITHFDIGGYTTFSPLLVRREELLLRSAELAAFGPMFRTHQGNQPEENAQFYSSPKISKKVSRLARIFVMLKPYTKSVVERTVKFGIPVFKPVFFNYPDDSRTYNTTYQFLFGDDLILAPVIEDFREHWNVYLPHDLNSSWIHLWSGKEYQGPVDIVVFAPLGQPPVFYRSNSPFRQLFQNISSIV